MKLLIAGSRSINEFDLEKYVPRETTMIITGGAYGIDVLAELQIKIDYQSWFYDLDMTSMERQPQLKEIKKW